MFFSSSLVPDKAHSMWAFQAVPLFVDIDSKFDFDSSACDMYNVMIV